MDLEVGKKAGRREGGGVKGGRGGREEEGKERRGEKE